MIARIQWIDRMLNIATIIQHQQYFDLKISGQLDESQDYVLGVGIRNDDPLLLSIYERAIGGDNAAAELILSRMIAPLKPSREPAALPGNPDPTNPASIAQAAMAGLAAGQLSSDAAGELLKALESLVTIAATLQLQPQLEAMQQQLGQLIEARGGQKRLRGV